VPGIAPEFVFAANSAAAIEAPGTTMARGDGRVRVRGLRTGTDATISVRTSSGARVRVVLLSATDAQNLWRVRFAGADRIVLSSQEVYADGARLHLRAKGQPNFSLAIFPALASPPQAGVALRHTGADGIFARYSATLPARHVTVTTEKLRDADEIGPIRKFNAVTWRKVEIALAPSDSAFDSTARYRISVPSDALAGVGDVFLEIRYVGDVARLYAGDELLNDNFYNGTPWRISLDRYRDAIRRGPLELRILPLRGDAPIYIPASHRPDIQGQRAELLGVTAIPAYDLVVR
jgi:hypothetical protein